MIDEQHRTILMACLILEDHCFARWLKGGEYRMGQTFKEHCIMYFQPNVAATTFLTRAQNMLPEGDVGDAPFDFYMAALRAEREQFAAYTDEQAQEVLDVWKKSKGLANVV